ncbi:sulfur carrier protein ThiS [Sulfurimonas aquatica]|uniref:Sulfur carrier protein ThiS n=1 Tax=Sulfurimonas aquatica TaxID=2672570 RepID=A0A975B0T2_9BACT|nr:sulfur carrier protein ThiS [Sulfurimonas aquatica]QSZ42117.1 sulfur carrier protein ThiS [Sulfurimonas aquatica]
MNIIVNGQDKDFPLGTTILQLLQALSLEGKVMAAAVNMDIVKQDTWSKHELNDGDKLELLDFVGGG